MDIKNAWRLDGNVAVITGGSEGIGLATAKEFVQLGCEVIIASRSENKLRKAKDEINSPLVSTVAVDLTQASSREVLIRQVERRGRLDILVNNLGQSDRDFFLEMSDERVLHQLELNLLATMSMTKGFYAHLKDSAGRVINISSVSAQRSLPKRLWYGVAKAALEQATKALAVEWGSAGIRVNAVAPWFTETPLTQGVLDNPIMKEKILGLTPLERVALPQDIARAIAFLAMPASGYITGVVLNVDGGYTAQGGLG